MSGIKGHIFRTAGTAAVCGVALVAGVLLSVYLAGLLAALIEKSAYH